MRHRLVPLLAVLVLVLASASCSDDGGEPELTLTETGGKAPVVSVSRDQRPRANLTDGKPGDHIHVAFGIYICDEFLEPPTDKHPDELGIHTHGDGVIHVHPFSNEAAGPNARLRVFFAGSDIRVQGGDLQVDDTRVQEGKTKCDGKPGELQLAYWRDGPQAAGSPPDQVFTSLSGDASLFQDLSAYTLAFVPKGTEIPPPPSAKDVQQLGEADR